MEIVESVFMVIGIGFSVAYLVYLGTKLWDKIGNTKDLEDINSSIRHLETKVEELENEIEYLTDDVNYKFGNMEIALKSRKR